MVTQDLVDENQKTTVSDNEVIKETPETIAENLTEEKTIETVAENSAPAPAPAPAPAGSVSFKPLNWLVEKGDSAYTLQLLATSEKKGLISHIDKNGIKGNMIILETRRNGADWYSLLYGAYKSRNEAIKARDALPQSYKASKAWARSVKSIKPSN